MHVFPSLFFQYSWGIGWGLLSKIVCLNSELHCFVLRRVDDLATIAVQLLKDATHLSPAEEPDGESLSQRVFMALTPSEHQLNFLRNEYSKVSLIPNRTFFGWYASAAYHVSLVRPCFSFWRDVVELPKIRCVGIRLLIQLIFEFLVEVP